MADPVELMWEQYSARLGAFIRGWLANQARYVEREAGTRAGAARQAPAAAGRRGALRLPALRVSHPAQVALAVPAAGCGCGPLEAMPAACTEPGSSCSGDQAAAAPCSCGTAPAQPRITPAAFLKELWHSARYLAVMFTSFAWVGFFLNGLIPPSWVTAVFGSGHVYGVPLAATLGLPFYVNAEASLPLVRALLDAGMSPGAALAFLIAGSGTSLGAIAGALTIARWRVVALVVGVLWAGAILCGLAFDLARMLQLL